MHGSHTTSLATASLAMLLVPVQFASADDNNNNNNNNNNNILKRHVQLVTPKPYIWDEYGPTNPLNPDGSDYPCKVPHGEKFQISGGTPTEMVTGEAQVVSFAGTAVHGGGSCQFALTEGVAPTRDSAWRVVHSVEGGCPKAHAAGNLGAGQSPDNYTFSVPEDFAPGDYTFAWTWVNRIAGEPEFYMNCAPVTVRGAAGGSARGVKGRRAPRGRRGGSGRGRRRDDDGQSRRSYPDLFLANIGNASNGCETSGALRRQLAIRYPHPGGSVSHPDGTAGLFRQPCDGNPRNANGSVAAAASASRTAAGTTALPTPARTTRAASSGSPPTPDASASSPLHPASSAADGPTVSTAGPSGAATPGSSCTDGHLLCVDGTRFSTCTGGEWTAPQDLASNSRCKEEGESVGLDISNVS